MKRGAILMAVLALAAGCDDDSPTQPSNTGPIVFTAQLSALNEVPPVGNAESGGRGTATITFNVPRDSAGAITGGGTVTFAIQLNGFPANTPVNLAHIHPGAQGVNGGVLVNTGLSAACATPAEQRHGQSEHHRQHFAGRRDEHHGGAGEFLFQRAHDAESQPRGGTGAAGAAVGPRVRSSGVRRRSKISPKFADPRPARYSRAPTPSKPRHF